MKGKACISIYIHVEHVQELCPKYLVFIRMNTKGRISILDWIQNHYERI